MTYYMRPKISRGRLDGTIHLEEQLSTIRLDAIVQIINEQNLKDSGMYISKLVQSVKYSEYKFEIKIYDSVPTTK